MLLEIGLLTSRRIPIPDPEDGLVLNSILLDPIWELPKNDDGGGPTGVNELVEDGGGPAGVVEGFEAKLEDKKPFWFRDPGVDGGLEE